MVDYQVVCCLCGDVGFSDKLFRCNSCLNRFQHSYCSNYYSESAEPMEQCDWCRSEQRSSSSKIRLVSRKSAIVVDKNHDNSNNNMVEKTVTTPKSNNNASGSGVPSPRTATRRYKLLKDVMC